MSAEASMQCQAAYGERTDDRVNSRNGYRDRRWDTRVGTIDLTQMRELIWASPGIVEGSVRPPRGRR
jgi:transposase-like protein